MDAVNGARSQLMAGLEFALACFLVALNAFFVAAEFALVKVRATRVQQLAEQGERRAAAVMAVLHQLEAHLSATQLGITLSSLGLGWIGEPAVADLLSPPLAAAGAFVPPLRSPLVVHTIAFVVGFSVITVLHIVMGELVPKSMAIVQAERIALWCAGPLRRFYRLFRWPIRFLNVLARAMLGRMGIPAASEHEMAHSNEELRMLVSASARGGYLDETERALLDNVFDFSERVAREVMVPRNEMTCLFADDPIQESLNTALQAGHTRFPLCEGEKDNVIGMVHLRDLYRRCNDLRDLKEVMRPPMIVPETISVSRLLKEFQRQASHLAILVDEYGGTAGLVTLEDLLEEIVGEIPDEFGREEPELTAVGAGAFEVDGSMLLEDVAEQLHIKFEEVEGVDTIGGYVLWATGARPEVGQSVAVGEHVLRVAEIEGFRITLVHIAPRATENGVNPVIFDQFRE